MLRHERAYNAIKALFDTKMNELLTVRAIRKHAKAYNEEEIYHALRKLRNNGYVNTYAISHKRYYWIARHR